MRFDAHKITTSSPDDLTGLRRLVESGVINPSEVICIIGKTEGNGGTNDFTRNLAMLAFEEFFGSELNLSKAEINDRIIFSLSGGCEGAVSPHIIVFTRNESGEQSAEKSKRLCIGTGFTREFKPEEIGRLSQIEETATTIKSILDKMQIEDTRDVHLIQMKGAIPSFTFEEAEKARKAHKSMRSDMVHSRGASALGAAVATGEVALAELTDGSVCQDWAKFSSVASCSAKPGLKRTEIMIMANSENCSGDLAIEHSTLQDMLDVRAVHEVLGRLNLKPDVQLTREQSEKIIGVFAKSEADPRGQIRGRRHTMLTDDDISDTRYSRCVLSSVISSIIGDTTVYVSTRAEHHGPLGGGTLAILSRV